jgi:3-oxoacyl-[acyl-carrier-protein] synthase II
MEHLSLSTVFGEHIKKIPVSSNKSMIGHTLSPPVRSRRQSRC